MVKSSKGGKKHVQMHSMENEDLQELNIKYAELMSQLEYEKNRAKQLKERKKAMKEQGVWCGEIDELDLNQLMNLKASLVDLKKRIAAELARKMKVGGDGDGDGGSK